LARVKFLHTADLHLSRPFGCLPPNLAQERRRDQRRTLAKIADLVLERDADLLLIAGDLFDRPDPDPTDLEAVSEQLGRVAADGKRVFAIPGNHDYCTRNSFWHRLDIPGVDVFAEPKWRRVVLDDLGIAVAGSAFDRTQSERRAFENLDLPTDVPSLLLVHASYESFEGQMERYHPFSLSDLADTKAHYIALGHYHRLNTIAPDSAGPTACYPGSPEGLGFDAAETEERHVVLGEIGDDGGITLEPIPVNRRTMRGAAIDCTSFESATALYDAVRKLCEPTGLLQIRLTGLPPQEIMSAINEIPERFKESCFYISTDTSGLACPQDIPLDERTIRGRFCKCLLDQIENSRDHERRRLLRRALDLGLTAFSDG